MSIVLLRQTDNVGAISVVRDADPGARITDERSLAVAGWSALLACRAPVTEVDELLGRQFRPGERIEPALGQRSQPPGARVLVYVWFSEAQCEHLSQNRLDPVQIRRGVSCSMHPFSP
jgi:hypothetical protein